MSQLPIVGPLFRQQEFEADETELVIVLTPYLVEPPASPADVMTPNARLSQPTEQSIDERLAGVPSTANTLASPDATVRLAGGRADGGAGFILD